MTIKQIAERQAKDAAKFEVAKQIREILDNARKEYGPGEWDVNEMESTILEMVTED